MLLCSTTANPPRSRLSLSARSDCSSPPLLFSAPDAGRHGQAAWRQQQGCSASQSAAQLHAATGTSRTQPIAIRFAQPQPQPQSRQPQSQPITQPITITIAITLPFGQRLRGRVACIIGTTTQPLRIARTQTAAAAAAAATGPARRRSSQTIAISIALPRPQWLKAGIIRSGIGFRILHRRQQQRNWRSKRRDKEQQQHARSSPRLCVPHSRHCKPAATGGGRSRSAARKPAEESGGGRAGTPRDAEQ